MANTSWARAPVCFHFLQPRLLMNATDSDTRPAGSSSRNWMIPAAVIVALIAAVYFWGRVQTGKQLDAQKTSYEQRLGTMQEQLKQLRSELAASSNRNQLLLARTDLYRSAAELDQRNFGIANTRLQEAAAALGKVDGAVSGLEAAALGTLRAAIAQTDINVATDLQQQRNDILDFAERLDAMVTAPVAR